MRLSANTIAPAIGGHPRITGDGEHLTVVWHDHANVRSTSSADRGATWQIAAATLDGSLPNGPSFQLGLAAAGAARHVVWEEHTFGASPGDIYYSRSLDRGATWAAAAVRLDRATAANADSNTPQIACDGSLVVAVWQDGRNGALDIYCNRSLDGGASWLANDVRLDVGSAAGAAASRAPQVVCVGNQVTVVWTDNRSGDDDIYAQRSTDGGTTWLPADVRIDRAPNAKFAADVQLAAGNGVVHAVWDDGRNGLRDIYYSRSTDGGASWLAVDVRLDTDPPGSTGAEDPRIACAGNRVYVAWNDYRSWVLPHVWLNRSSDGGLTWSSVDHPVGTSTAACFAANPSLAADGTHVVVVWEAQQCGGLGAPDVFANRSSDGGATWLPFDVRLDTDTPGARASSNPRLHFVDGRCHVVWSDGRHSTNGGRDIYANVPFGSLPYGDGTPGTGGVVPRLAGSGTATLGGNVAIELTQGLGGTIGVLLFGGPGSRVSLPLFGGTILVAPTSTVAVALGGAPFVAGAGTATVPLTLPNVTALVGWNGNFQFVLLDGSAVDGLSLSNAVELWIG